MQDTAKYLVHADITADGVVERNDVVGAVFGQTEGLLGDELEIRDLQESSKLGRIDVEVESENGQSFGQLTIATSLDKVETAILAAALETIERVGPCRSTISVTSIEDVRAAKRRTIVERAKRLLAESFDGAVMSSDELIEEVRQSIRVEDITEYEGYPAGPRVADSDAVILVEGRADVLQLLKYGIKNAIAVEGTNVPSTIADLTRERTVTAFLDGDRGGDLILKELAQVGEVDYVTFAPPGESVEDLDRHAVMSALRDKVPYDRVASASSPREVAATDGSAYPAPGTASDAESAGPQTTERPSGESESPRPAVTRAEAAEADGDGGGDAPDASDETTPGAEGSADGAASTAEDATAGEESPPPETLGGHVREVVESGTGSARLLDADFGVLEEGEATDAFALVRDADPVPAVLVLDGELDQRLLDVCAQRGVEQVVARSEGEFVKRPASVRIRTAQRLLHPAEAE